MAEAIERGIDQVSGQMQAHLDAEYTGRSQGGHVTVKISGAGAIDEVRYDPRWLLEAHELNIGRETTDAFRAAYRRAGERTVADMVADSPLGEIQRSARIRWDWPGGCTYATTNAWGCDMSLNAAIKASAG